LRTSVVIPCYKNSEYLLDALNSLVHQSSPPLEIIVIDDGSPLPLEQPSHWRGPKLKWIRTVNRGLGAARNEGIRHAEGQFVGLLDSDDVWEPSKLEYQEKLLDDESKAVACYTHCVDEEGFFPFGPYPDCKAPSHVVAKLLWYGQFFPPSSVLIRREAAIAVGGFREGLKNGEDLDMWFRLFSQGEIFGVPKPLTKYRVHANQITCNTVRKVMGAKEARRGILSVESNRRLLELGGICATSFWDAYESEVFLTYYRRDFASARTMLWDYWLDHPQKFRALLYFLTTFFPAKWIARIRDTQT
jgi:glycosyltransferase involved in cell wall biosynthesis